MSLSHLPWCSFVESYQLGEQRTVHFTVTNTGDEALREVTLTDDTLSGATVTGLRWVMPGEHTAREASFDEATQQWIFVWADTFGAGTARWLPGEVITGEATLLLEQGSVVHADRATVTATGAGSRIPVTDEDAYYAATAAVQVLKYDGERADPQVRDADGAWVVPSLDATTDANTLVSSVRVTPQQQHTIRAVVTNTGASWLTGLEFSDLTELGTEVTNWTADLSEFGGSAQHQLAELGAWPGLLAPGASFFVTGTLEMGAGERHHDVVTVTVVPVVPETDPAGTPTGGPKQGPNGTPGVPGQPSSPVSGGSHPVVLEHYDEPVVVTDDDALHAHTGLSVTGAASLGGLLLLGVTVLGAGVWLLRRGRSVSN